MPTTFVQTILSLSQLESNRRIENIEAVARQSEMDRDMWRSKYYDLAVHANNKDKQLAALSKQLGDYEVEFKKNGLEGVPPAVAFDHLVCYFQDSQGQIKLLKFDLFDSRREWAAL